MYFPYFRGKQYELIAIRESTHLFSDNEIIPILEPVKRNLATLKKTIETLVEEECKFVLIVNPRVGELKNTNAVVGEIVETKLRGFKGYYLGLIVHSQTKTDDIEDFLNEHKGIPKCLIHSYSFKGSSIRDKVKGLEGAISFNIFDLSECGDAYIKGFDCSNAVALRDDFKDEVRNADYPEDDFFSDLCFVYESAGFVGYGDFLTVGKAYAESGGPAYVVTIHLTYPEDGRELRIRHFSSDSNSELPIDQGGKFAEAVDKLVEFVDTLDEKIRGKACEEFVQLHEEDRYPGLGVVKKLSMKHHLEIMATLGNE